MIRCPNYGNSIFEEADNKLLNCLYSFFMRRFKITSYILCSIFVITFIIRYLINILLNSDLDDIFRSVNNLCIPTLFIANALFHKNSAAKGAAICGGLSVLLIILQIVFLELRQELWPELSDSFFYTCCNISWIILQLILFIAIALFAESHRKNRVILIFSTALVVIMFITNIVSRVCHGHIYQYIYDCDVDNPRLWINISLLLFDIPSAIATCALFYAASTIKDKQ